MTMAAIDLGLAGCGIVIRRGPGDYGCLYRGVPPRRRGARTQSIAEDLGWRCDRLCEWLTGLLLSHGVRAIMYEEPTIVRIGGRVSVRSTLPQWMAYAALRCARVSLGVEGISLHALHPLTVRRLLGVTRRGKEAVWGVARALAPDMWACIDRALADLPPSATEHVCDAGAIMSASRMDDALSGLWGPS